MSKPIPKLNLYVLGQCAYWDYGRVNCMDGMLSEAQLDYFRKGFIDARKEDKGR